MQKFLKQLSRGTIIELSGWDWNTSSKFIDEIEASNLDESVGPVIHMIGYYLNHDKRIIRCAAVRVEFSYQEPDVKYVHEIRLAAIDKILILGTYRRWNRA